MAIGSMERPRPGIHPDRTQSGARLPSGAIASRGSCGSCLLSQNELPEYEGLLQSGDFGPVTGHYHVFIELDGFMVPWTGQYTDSLCWTTRSGPRRGLRSYRGAVAIIGVDHNWYDCEDNDDTWEDAGVSDYTRWYAQTRDRLKGERPEADAREVEKLMDKEVQHYQWG